MGVYKGNKAMIFGIVDLPDRSKNINLLPGPIASFASRIKLISLSPGNTYLQHMALLFL